MASIKDQINDSKKLAESQLENARLQKEYNEALKMSQSFSNALLKDIDAEVDYRTIIGKRAKEYLGTLKASIGELESSSDIAKKIADIEVEKVRVSTSYFGANKAQGEIYLNTLDTALTSLKIEQQRLAVTEKVSEAANEVANSMSSMFDGLVDGVREIPLIGGVLGKLGDAGSKALKDKLGNAAMTFTTDFAAGLKGGATTMEALSGAASGLGTSLMAALTSPLVIIGLIVGALALAFKRFSELDSAAKQFREETGLLNSQTKQLGSNIKSVSTEFAGLGVSAAEVSKAAAAFTNELKPSEQVSKETLSSMVALNKNFGVGVTEGAKLNKVFQNIGGLSQEQSQALIGQTAQMAKLAGVAPSKVIEDMADNSEYAYRYFNGSPQALAKAAVQAAKLGTSIGQAGKVADGLLDFQSSITSELEASALLGTNINLGQARYLAANGKVLESQQAVLDEVASLGDLTKLNTFEQDALTKATGMQMDELINQQRIREQFGKLEGEQLAAATSLLQTGKDISKMNASDLDAQTKKLASQKEMQSQMDNLTNSIGAIGTGFMDALAPMATYLIPVFTDLIDMTGSILLPLLKGIGSAFRIIFGVLGAVVNVFMTVLKPVVAIVGAIIEGIMTPINMIADALDPLFAKFAELKDKVMQAITPILPIFTFLGKLIGTIVGGAIGTFVDVLIKGFDILFGVIETISNFITTYIVNPIMSIITAIQGVFTSVKSFIGLGDEPASNNGASPLASTAPAINDGVVQDGKVVSTNPADTIFAMKKPEDLAKSGTTIQQSPTIDISSLVNKMDEMIAAVSANRDVYMDREKVSSAVVTTSEKSSQNRFGLMGA